MSALGTDSKAPAASAETQPLKEHTQGRAEWVTLTDGRKLFTQVLNGPSPDAPTVIFEAGAMATRSSFALVQPRVATFARAIVYDRSGLGRSPPDWTDRSMARMADDLAQVVDHFAPTDATGQPLPTPKRNYILVSHSLGGPIVRLAIPLRPKLVSGAVLIDPTDENLASRFTPEFKNRMKWINNIAWGASYLMSGLRYFGIRAPAGPFEWMRDMAPPDVQADMDAETLTPDAVNTGILQSNTWMDDMRVWQSEPPAVVEDVPVTIISGGKDEDKGPKIFDREEVNKAHEARVATYKTGRHVIAPNSGHYVVFTDVDLVVEEIRRLAEGPTSS